MGIFASKDQKALAIAMDEVKSFFDGHYKDWERTLALTIGAKRASEFPVEQIEPTIRQMWVECYARSIVFENASKVFYENAAKKYPNLRSHLPITDYRQAVSFQLSKFGGLLGTLVKEICDIKPDYLSVLEKHLDEPELSIIKNEAMEAVAKGKN